MPKPPAAFSPLTMTRSSFQSRDQPGQALVDDRAPGAAHHIADEENAHVSFTPRGNRSSRAPLARDRGARRGRWPERAAISCAAKAMPTATTGFIARSARWSCRNSRRHSRCDGRRGRKQASGTIRMSGATSGASGFGSRMPHCPASSASPNAHARMISGLPRPSMAGSARCAPASASLRISGSGLISVFSGMKPETIVPGLTRRERRGRDRLGGRRTLGGGHRVARGERVVAESGFLLGRRCGIGHARLAPQHCVLRQTRAASGSMAPVCGHAG